MRFSAAGNVFVGGVARRRRRRSRLPARLEVNELKDPWVDVEELREKAALDAEMEEDCMVSCEEIVDAAWKAEKPEPLLEPLRRFPRDGGEGEISLSKSVLATALAVGRASMIRFVEVAP